MLRTAKLIGALWHRLIARYEVLAIAYLRAISIVLRHTPDRLLKTRIINSLSVQKWPDHDFKAERIRVAPQTVIQLTPHWGEFDMDALFYRRLNYEQEMFSFLEPRVGNYDAIVEIGANVGVFTVFFSQVIKHLNKPCPVFAFEPSQEAYRRLLQNLAANPDCRASPYNCAIAETPGFLTFYEPSGHLTNGSLSKNFAERFSEQTVARTIIAIDGIMLSQLVANYTRLLIKIDVEGAEEEVLRSLQLLIESKRPDLIVEVLPSYDEKLNSLNFLRERYLLYNITSKGLELQPQFNANAQYRDYFLSAR